MSYLDTEEPILFLGDVWFDFAIIFPNGDVPVKPWNIVVSMAEYTKTPKKVMLVIQLKRKNDKLVLLYMYMRRWMA